MGWKAVRDHYGIRHIVQIRDGDLLIGSGYVSDIVVVAPDGSIRRFWDMGGSELAAIRDAIAADPETYVRLLAAEDSFEASIPVYAWDGERVVRRLCEEPGWPNVTHDGHIMYQNDHFPDPLAAARRARDGLLASVATIEERIAEVEGEQATRRSYVEERRAALERLLRDHPGASAPASADDDEASGS